MEAKIKSGTFLAESLNLYPPRRKTFISLERLERLDLASNSLEEVPGRLLRSLRRLNSLNLGQNNLVSLHDEAFTGLKVELADQCIKGIIDKRNWYKN